MKRMTYFVMALALVLGFTQCKKEQPTPQTQGVRITLNVNGGNSNSRVIVDPNGNNGQYNYATVNFETGDVIYVGYNNAYVGTLTYSNGTFSGSVNIDSYDGIKPLHFYFLGGVGFTPTIDETNNTATVNISNQTTKYPVISYAPSKQAFTGEGAYSAKLQNKVSIMKFNVTTPSTAPICITGMNNKVTVDFGKTAEEGDGLGENPTNQGFSFGKEGEGVIKMRGVTTENTTTWAILLPQDALEAGEAYTEDGDYKGTRDAIEGGIGTNQYLSDGFPLTVNTPIIINLANQQTNCQAQDGQILTGTLGSNVKISIADGATVTLRDVTINGDDNPSYKWAGLTCEGDATIILEGENTVKGFHGNYPGIHVPVGKTLTIQGSGTLDASSNAWGAGIGGGVDISCGNITINGGTVTATAGDEYSSSAGLGSCSNGSCGDITITGGTVTAKGDDYGAGIGSGFDGSCGDITITGGTVTATGGECAAGIGSGYVGSCGDITITAGVTEVTAIKGENASNSIGKGYSGTCGTVTIGGTVYPDGISVSPYTYQP